MRDHVLKFWLPLFWGFKSQEFISFIKLCCDASLYEEEVDEVHLEITETALWNTEWSWWNKTLSEFIEPKIRAKLGRRVRNKEMENYKARIIRGVWHLISEAVKQAKQTEPKNGDMTIVQALHPNYAISRVIRCSGKV